MINTTDIQKLYTDIDFDFKKNETTNDLKTRVSSNAISQSIKNIIMTSQREKPFNRNTWYGIYDNLFENYEPLFAIVAKSKIANTINTTEPRVTVDPNDVQITQKSNFDIEINIKYKIKDPNTGMGVYDQSLTLQIGGQ
jgi:phage baseplate assembly protein W